MSSKAKLFGLNRAVALMLTESLEQIGGVRNEKESLSEKKAYARPV